MCWKKGIGPSDFLKGFQREERGVSGELRISHFEVLNGLSDSAISAVNYHVEPIRLSLDNC